MQCANFDGNGGCLLCSRLVMGRQSPWLTLERKGSVAALAFASMEAPQYVSGMSVGVDEISGKHNMFVSLHFVCCFTS